MQNITKVPSNSRKSPPYYSVTFFLLKITKTMLKRKKSKKKIPRKS